MTQKTDEELIAEAVAAGRVKRYWQGAVGTWQETQRQKNVERSKRAFANSRAAAARRSAAQSNGPGKAADGS